MSNLTNLQKKLALAGAQVRLAELRAEMNEIHQMFPELRSGTSARAAASGKRRFSAKGKAAISEGMRKYWARRKAAAAKAAKSK